MHQTLVSPGVHSLIDEAGYSMMFQGRTCTIRNKPTITTLGLYLDMTDCTV